MHLIVGLADVRNYKFLTVPMNDRTLSINPTKGIAFPK
jgi:hypothetical protein